MKKILSILVIVAVIVFLNGVAVAGGKATEAECVAKCKAAAKMVQEKGLEAALNEIDNPKGAFVWKDTYVFALDIDKHTVLAHPFKPGLKGKVLIGIKDVKGKMFFAEMCKMAKTNKEGWVEYMWPRPGEKKPSPKKTYIYRVPSTSVAMAAGIYY